MGITLLAAGFILLGAFPRPGLAIALTVSGLLALIAGVVFAVKDAQARSKSAANRVMFGLVSMVTMVVFFGFLASFEFSKRPKASTVGYAEFNDRSGEIRFQLPDGWKTRYYSRNPPYFYQGIVEDNQGRRRLNVYAGVLLSQGKPLRLEEYAIQKTADLENANLALLSAEFRDASSGRCWVYYLNDADNFGNQPARRVEYLQQRGDHLLLLEFNMLAEEVDELESLTWQWVRNARIHLAH